MKMNQTFKAIVLTATLGLASTAQAATYSYQINNPHGGDEAGDITSFWTSYNSDTQELSWQSTISATNGVIANSFWLVLSDGPDPMLDRNEYAILYGDSHSGNLAAYVYNGHNSGSSWNTPGEFIHTYGGAFESTASSTGESIFSFSIDASIVNDFYPRTPGTTDWDGLQFDENIGIWYHPAFIDKPASFDSDGALVDFPEIVSGFFDVNNQDTDYDPIPTTDPIVDPIPDVTSVPEPGTFALISLGLFGLFVRRQTKRS